MPALPLLELRSNAVGLPGPYLQENLAAYESLDVMGERKPIIIQAIGGITNRQSELALPLSLDNDNVSNSVILRQLNTGMLCFHCMLHRQSTQIPRLKGGYEPGDTRLHLLAAKDPTRVAWDIYSLVLSPFCDAMVVIASEFGSLHSVIDFLCCFTRFSSPSRRKRIFIVHDDMRIDQGRFTFDLAVAALSSLRASDPVSPLTVTEAREWVATNFDLSHMSTTDPLLFDKVISESRVIRKERERERLVFSALQTRQLLRQVISTYALQPLEEPDFVLASRVNLPSEGTVDLMTLFFKHFSGSNDEAVSILASALVVATYPPGMHDFPPAEAFSKLWKGQARMLSGSSRAPKIVDRIETAFISLAHDLLETEADIRKAHCVRLQGSRSMRDTDFKGCSFCIIKWASHFIVCGHRLCDECIQVFNPLCFCPVCQQPNARSPQPRHLTAGTRELHISGQNAQDIVVFLQDLQQNAGLNSSSLRDHFDNVSGADFGVFFVLAIFIEGWSITDCKYHLPRLKRLKLLPKISSTAKLRLEYGAINFGKGLTWSFSEIESKNGKIIGSGVHNATISVKHQPASVSPPDIQVRYLGSAYGSVQLARTSHKLFACLFYIELASSPVFYSSPETYGLKLLCRLPPGHALLDLLFKLQRENAYLIYKGAENTFHCSPLCTKQVMAACQKGEPFFRSFYVAMLSADSFVDARIRTPAEESCISNCPYKLRDIARDQGIDCFFRDARASTAAMKARQPPGVMSVLMESQKLIDSL